MAMWRRWSLRAKVVLVTVGVVLPIVAAIAALAIRMSREGLGADLRDSGLVLARELAASAVSDPAVRDARTLQQEIGTLLGKRSPVRIVAVYALGPRGLILRAAAGAGQTPMPEDELAAREDQEVVVLRQEGAKRAFHVAVPVREGGRSVGVVVLELPLDRADALARRAERRVFGLSAVTLVLLVGSLSILMNRAVTAPIRRVMRVIRRAEGGDLAARVREDREDEVGQVAVGLNRLLERVGSFHAELARRVAEATGELRAVNQRLYAAQQQVARNEHLAAAGELAAAMAHDVGTPLAAVSGHLQLLEEEVADPSVKERLRMIQGHVDRVEVAARGFLDAARAAPARVPVDVNALLADLLLLTSPEAQRKGIAVVRGLAAELPPLAADPEQLQELFLNLIGNALDAMDSGGTLRLATQVVRDGAGAAGVQVVVEDTGPGMAPQVLARAFEPFFTSKGSQGGTGLGLAICRRIAREHGGTIRLESGPGRGTRAIVDLPVEGR